jgi:hypothetical protein
MIGFLDMPKLSAVGSQIAGVHLHLETHHAVTDQNDAKVNADGSAILTASRCRIRNTEAQFGGETG